MSTLVFAHIPKTAGTTISNSLATLFDPDKISGHIDAAPPASTEGLDFIVSHFPFPHLDRIEGEKTYVTCLREPVSRLKSIYQFWHSLTDFAALQSGNAQLLDVRRMSFDQFISSDDPDIIKIVDNGMVRHFAEVSSQVGETEFAAACRAIDKMSAIVLYERLSETMMELYERLHCRHRLALKHLNVTSSNHEHNPSKYRKIENVETDSMTPDVAKTLIAYTSYDLRLYNYALLRRGSLDYKALDISEKLRIKRTVLMRGETVTSSKHENFVRLLGRGWTTPEEVLWTMAPLAELMFQVQQTNCDHPTRIKIRFSGCLIPRRDYLLGSVSVDGSRPKGVLFLNTNCTIEIADVAIGVRFDTICAGAQSVEIIADLATSSDPDFLHKVEFRCSGTSPPAVLAYNNDDRALGIRLESLHIL